ncbi:hypothetical protein N7517_010799 [Penicillium concentricum]|uniref:Uncharacterized protein n=1 Tax=Penicillium concentricum TaxID=293559 RepID=A0A9W9RAV8_9EURO|nr:uncharacterized protein N7517_010799 [Penicillium concentricum]KAJ5356190.1 hypothetical protein N7517_010799 [Penicillium concentricum]
MGHFNKFRGMETGQIVAIHLETTRSRSVTFRSPDFHSISLRRLQHDQFQGGSDEKLTAISWILNVTCERVRAVISTNGNRRNPPILVPEQPPPFDQVRKLHFERQNDDGCKESIIKAEAYFTDQSIVGLVFVYTSGKTVSTGELDTKARQTVHFAPGARIVGLSAAFESIYRKIIEIEFEVERNEQPRGRCEKLELSIAPAGDRRSILNSYQRDVWFKNNASARSYKWVFEGDKVYKPPSGSRLVGIYMGCQELSRIGALYEPNVSQ